MSLLNHVEVRCPNGSPRLTRTALPNPKAGAEPNLCSPRRQMSGGTRTTALCTLAFSTRLDVCTLSLTPRTCGRGLPCACSHLLSPD